MVRLAIRFAFLSLLLFSALWVRSQEYFSISGMVLDSSGVAIPGAVVSVSAKEAIHPAYFSLSRKDGSFLIRMKRDSISACRLNVRASGYQHDSSLVIFNQIASAQELIFRLRPTSITLKEVIVKAEKLPFIIRNDTIEFNAKSFIHPETKKLQDLLANIHGFRVASDGRISFNGKEVEKILIEGEDLSEKNYRLLSRNLNASMISKVQVINNYNNDRLIKEVERSENIGINLVIDEKFKNQVTGSLDLQAGTASRKSIDNNLVLITKKLKLLAFIKYNNIGDIPNADLRYYYNKDNTAEVSGLENLNSTDLVRTGLIYPPDLPGKYIRNNSDYSAAVIASWKVGASVKMRAILGYSRSSLENRNKILDVYTLPDLDQWLLYQEQFSKIVSKDLISGISFSHDRGNKNIGSAHIELSLPNTIYDFESRITGTFQDSLLEKSQTSKKILRLDGFESIRIRQNRILNIHYRLNSGNSSQAFNPVTGRFTGFFQIDSGALYFSQHLQNQQINAELSAGFYGTSGKLQYSLLVKSNYQQSGFDGSLNNYRAVTQTQRIIRVLNSCYESFEYSLVASGNIPLMKKIVLSSVFKIGRLNNKFLTSSRTLRLPMPVFRNITRITYQRNPITNLNFDYQFSYGKSLENYFFPDSLISGNVSVLCPADEIKAFSKHSFNIVYSTSNLRRSSELMLQLSASFADRDYSYGYYMQPEYSLYFFHPFDGNRHMQVLGRFEKLLMSLRMKLGLQISAMEFKMNMLVNETRSVNLNRNERLEFRIASAFKGPFNFELKPFFIHSTSKTKLESSDWTSQDFWQFQGSGKLMVRPGDKWYFAAVYLYRSFSYRSYFNSADMYVQWQAHPDWSFSLAVHNLFNAGAMVSREYTPTSYGDQRFSLMGRYFLLGASWSF